MPSGLARGCYIQELRRSIDNAVKNNLNEDFAFSNRWFIQSAITFTILAVLGDADTHAVPFLYVFSSDQTIQVAGKRLVGKP